MRIPLTLVTGAINAAGHAIRDTINKYPISNKAKKDNQGNQYKSNSAYDSFPMWAAHYKVTIKSDIAKVSHLISQTFARPSTHFYADEDDVRLIQTFYVTVSNTA